MGIREFFYNLLFGKAKPTPPVSPRPNPAPRPVNAPKPPTQAPVTPPPVVPPPQAQQDNMIHFSVYIDQVAAFFRILSETPDSLNLPKLSGVKRFVQSAKFDWKSPAAVDAHLRRLSMDKLCELMESIGYDVHHVLPVDTFDLSWAFREHFRRYRGNDRIAFNAEYMPGQTPDQIMLNALYLLTKFQLVDGKVFGVHGVHPEYNVAIARYMDLREVEIIAELKLQVDASGINLKPAEFEKAVEKHFHEDLLKFTRKLKSKLIDACVRGNNGQYVEVNEIFGKRAELQKDEAFLRSMKNF